MQLLPAVRSHRGKHALFSAVLRDGALRSHTSYGAETSGALAKVKLGGTKHARFVTRPPHPLSGSLSRQVGLRRHAQPRRRPAFAARGPTPRARGPRRNMFALGAAGLLSLDRPRAEGRGALEVRWLADFLTRRTGASYSESGTYEPGNGNQPVQHRQHVRLCHLLCPVANAFLCQVARVDVSHPFFNLKRRVDSYQRVSYWGGNK